MRNKNFIFISIISLLVITTGSWLYVKRDSLFYRQVKVSLPSDEAPAGWSPSATPATSVSASSTETSNSATTFVYNDITLSAEPLPYDPYDGTKTGQIFGSRVYIESNGKKEVLLDKVPGDAEGGELPSFFETGRKDVIVFTTTYQNYGFYYIDIPKRAVTRVDLHSGIQTPDGKVAKLSLLTEDHCGDPTSGKRKVGEYAALYNDIAVNGIARHMIATPIPLRCGEGEMGDTTFPFIDYEGITNDLSKIFFSIWQWQTQSDQKNPYRGVLLNTYSLDLRTQKVVAEHPYNLLTAYLPKEN